MSHKEPRETSPQRHNEGPEFAEQEGDPIVVGYARRVKKRTPRRWILACAAAVVLFVVGFYVLSFPRERNRRRSVCALNLRAIGQALHMYAFDKGSFPPNLRLLVDAGILMPKQLRCPNSPESKPGWSDYWCVTGLAEGDPSRWILAFDNPANHPDGGNILYLDGHVEYYRTARYAAELDRFKKEFETSRGHPPRILTREKMPALPSSDNP